MSTKDLSKMSLFLALIIISAFFSIPLPFVMVPIVLQNMVAMISGGILGMKRGGLVVLVFLLLVGLGLPFLPGGRGGAAVFFSPSGGFLIGYGISAFLVGYFADKLGRDKKLKLFLIYFIFGSVLINFAGTFSLTYFGKMPYIDALKTALVFIPVDTLKALLASFVTWRIHLSGLDK